MKDIEALLYLYQPPEGSEVDDGSLITDAFHCFLGIRVIDDSDGSNESDNFYRLNNFDRSTISTAGNTEHQFLHPG